MACRNGGTVSVPGVYGGFIDKFPMGAVDEPLADDQDRARRTCSATCGRCWSASESGEIDPSFVITHRMSLDDAPHGFDTFLNKEDDCMKVVMSP